MSNIPVLWGMNNVAGVLVTTLYANILGGGGGGSTK